MTLRRGAAWAPVNIALVKHWGCDDHNPGLPARPSLSLTLEHGATTSVEWDPRLRLDEISVNGRLLSPEDGDKAAAAYRLLHRIRTTAGLHGHGARVTSESAVPLSSGFASSASGGAALTLAALQAAGLADQTDERERIEWCAITGSISAVRSLRGGVVVLEEEGGSLRLRSVRTPLELSVLTCRVDARPKLVSSSAGHRSAPTSPYFREFVASGTRFVEETSAALERGDIEALTTLVEHDAQAMHAVMLSSRPPIVYATDTTWSVWRQVARWREEGIQAACTLDAGANPHVLCLTADAAALEARLRALPGVERVMRSAVIPWGAQVLAPTDQARVVM